MPLPCRVVRSSAALTFALSVAITVAGCASGERTSTSEQSAQTSTSPSAEGSGEPVGSPKDEQLVPVIENWAHGDDAGDGELACSALTVERAEEERREAQEEGRLFATCEEMYADDPPYHPKGELLEYSVERRDPAVALVRAVFDGGSVSESVYMFGLVPVEGAWLIGDRELLSD